MGTELGRRGVDTRGPLFSAAALLDGRGRALVRALHREYVEAGAEVVTACTFRTTRRAAGPRWRELLDAAVAAARDSGARVAGSMAPLEDCYRPELRPPPEIARREYAELAEALAGGCDLLLVETVASAEEGLATLEAAAATGLPVWVAAQAGPRGTMLDGSDLRVFFAAAAQRGARALLVNCTPCDGIDAVLDAAAPHGLPFGAYANAGEIDPASGWQGQGTVSPERYAERARAWIARGASIVGGCCGTGPDHVRRLAR